MKKFSVLAFALFSFTTLIAKEYSTKKELLDHVGDMETNKRNWTHADRANNTDYWKESCLFNFAYAEGSLEYTNIEQREDFLTWLSLELKRKGHEVKWVDMVITVGELIKPAANGSDNVSLFANLGNKVVFDGTFTRLQALYRMEKPLKGEEAKAWDDAMIQFEQEHLIQPIFNKMDIVTLEKVTKMAKGEGLYSLVVKERLEFPGDLRNMTDRINYAEKILLPYVNEEVSEDLQSIVASENIIAEDRRALRAAEKYLERLDKETATPTEVVEEVKAEEVKEPKMKKVKEEKVKVEKVKPVKVKKAKKSDLPDVEIMKPEGKSE